MKKSLLFAGLFLLFSVCIFAQAKPDYSGNWTLDLNQSKMNSLSRVATMTLKVTQTTDKITIETATTYTSAMAGGGNGVAFYPLDGKEITVERESTTFGRKVQVKRNGEILTDGKLSLTSASPATRDGVEYTSNLKDIWSLSADGKTLKILRSFNVLNMDDQVSELIFKKS